MKLHQCLLQATHKQRKMFYIRVYLQLTVTFLHLSSSHKLNLVAMLI